MRVDLAIVALAASVALTAGCTAPSQTAVYGQPPSQSLAELLEARVEKRAYDGAPPVIPHDVEGLGREDCLACHQPGSYDNPERIAAPRSHPAWGDCRQCHVERRVETQFRSNSFEGLWWPSKGPRQSEFSPPMIPHHIQNREECAVCHVGAQAHPALRAEHGFRHNCQQCHVGSVQ